MKKIRFLRLTALFLLLSCRYEFSYQGELGRDILPRGSDEAFRVSMAVLSGENRLLVQTPPEDESLYEGPVHQFDLVSGDYLGLYTDSEGHPVRAGGNLLSPRGWLGSRLRPPGSFRSPHRPDLLQLFRRSDFP